MAVNTSAYIIESFRINLAQIATPQYTACFRPKCPLLFNRSEYGKSLGLI
jgi:hypothetical protein